MTYTSPYIPGGSTVRKIPILLWLAVALAGALFIVRGPLRASGAYVNDFAAPYTSSRLMLRQRNAYDPEGFWQEWHKAGAPMGTVYANPSSTHSVYPAPSLIVLVPLAFIQWHAAWMLFIALSVAAYVGSLLALCTLLPRETNNWKRIAFVIAGLLMAPAPSAIHVSNVACLSGGLLFLGLWLRLRSPNRWLISASLLAVSLCPKPTLAPLVLLYLVCAQAWRVLGVILGSGILSCLVFAFLERGTSWYASLLGNVELLFSSGVAALGPQNLTRSDRIDFQLPLYGMTRDIHFAALLAGVLTIVLLILCFAACKRHLKVTLDDELLLVSTLLVVGLLPFYQRFYCAMLLLLPVLWAIKHIQLIHGKIVLVLCSIFLANTSVLPRLLEMPAPTSRLTGLLIDAFLLPHLCWVILVLSLVLLHALFIEFIPKKQDNAVSSVS